MVFGVTFPILGIFPIPLGNGEIGTNAHIKQ